MHDSHNKVPVEQGNPFDYDKLAEAIVKAQKKAEESKPIKYGFIKNKDFRILLMNFFNIGIYLVAFIASLVAIIYICRKVPFNWFSPSTSVLVIFGFFTVFFFFMFY